MQGTPFQNVGAFLLNAAASMLLLRRLDRGGLSNTVIPLPFQRSGRRSHWRPPLWWLGDRGLCVGLRLADSHEASSCRRPRGRILRASQGVIPVGAATAVEFEDSSVRQSFKVKEWKGHVAWFWRARFERLPCRSPGQAAPRCGVCLTPRPPIVPIPTHCKGLFYF